jgi:hypothetical protein
MKNRVFFPQNALDAWIAEDRVELRNDELTIKSEGRKYKIIEAVRVMREVTNQPDVNELLGRVKSRAFLTELGAEVLEHSMLIGDNAYDVVPGFVGAPIGTFVEHAQSQRVPRRRELTSEEDLLASFLASKL